MCDENELLKQLNNTINVAARCKFYQKRGLKQVNSIKEFEDIELTTKEDLRHCKPYDVLCTDIENIQEYHESFGTTGLPVSVWYSKKDMLLAGKRLNDGAYKFKSNDIVLMRFPYAISIPAHTFSEAIHQKGGTIIPVSRGSKVTPYKRVINLMIKLKATVLACNPTEAFILSDVAKSLGYDLHKDFNIRTICTAGEMLCNERRLELSNIWGADIYNYYGMTEVANVAVSCKNGNLHCAPDGYYLEVIDPITKKNLGYGNKGILCVTQLDKEAFPLIRYETGDIVELKESKCSCGDKNTIIVHYGRLDDVIKIGNNKCTMGDFQNKLYSCVELHERKYWRLKVQNNKLTIYIENEIDSLDDNFKLDLPFDNKVVLVKRNTIENIPKLLENSELKKAHYFI